MQRSGKDMTPEELADWQKVFTDMQEMFDDIRRKEKPKDRFKRLRQQKLDFGETKKES